MSLPTFWDHKEEAQQTVSELSACQSILLPFAKVEEKVQDYLTILELIEEEGMERELLDEEKILWRTAQKDLQSLELLSFLGGKFDRGNAIVTLHPGSGGTESCDWAHMLFRMYTRWIERKGFQAHIVDLQSGDVAGIKSATMIVSGEYAYGNLQAERGVHRLVRISPFDSNKRRHTSFAAVEVVPEIDEKIEIEIDEKELRVDTYRSSGAGGQHVNTTDSAIRITHLPTGIAITCQNERSQHQNRATAMRILRSRLYEREQKELAKQQELISGPKEENAWGSQIRSYVLHPYQLVKDLRTDEQTSNISAVLDGEITPFIEAYLKTKK